MPQVGSSIEIGPLIARCSENTSKSKVRLTRASRAALDRVGPCLLRVRPCVGGAPDGLQGCDGPRASLCVGLLCLAGSDRTFCCPPHREWQRTGACSCVLLSPGRVESISQAQLSAVTMWDSTIARSNEELVKTNAVLVKQVAELNSRVAEQLQVERKNT